MRTEIFTTDLGAPASARTLRRFSQAEADRLSQLTPIHVAHTKFPLRFAYAPNLSSELANRAAEFDVIHINSLFLYPQFAAFRVARAHHIPYVVSPRGSLRSGFGDEGSPRKALMNFLWQREMLAGAGAIHVTSHGELEAAASISSRVPRALIPTPLNAALYEHLPDPAVFRAKFLNGRTSRVVLFLGRIARKKQVDLLVRAFALVSRSWPDTLLAIVGPDDENLVKSLRRLADELGVSRDVVFIDHVDGAEKLGALAVASVWALPSLTENFGVAAVEAMAAGIPTVLSDGVDIAPELAAQGACLICRQEPASIADAIDSLLQQPDLSKRVVEAGHRAVTRYSPSAIGAEFAALYDSVTGRS